MLDRLYTQFDALASEHGLFKVETIGDAARQSVFQSVSPPHPPREPRPRRHPLRRAYLPAR